MKLPVKVNLSEQTANITDADGECVAICWPKDAAEIAKRVNQFVDYRKAAEVEANEGDKARREASELRKALAEIAELSKNPQQSQIVRLINHIASKTLMANT